ncbi:MAG TPA: RluA family pseudouridine synthase [Polyangia bacterium]
MSRVVVELALAGLRLDQFLARALGVTSVHAARRLIAAGEVRVDGRVVAKKGDRVAAGQVVFVTGAGAGDNADGDADLVVPDPTVVLPVLFVDADLVAVNKPAGINAHPLRRGERGTAANGLCVLWPECARASIDPREAGLGHRLDRDTSGVLLAARNRAAWEALRGALSDPACEKTYLAQVAGAPPVRGQFDGAIGRHGRRGARVAIDGGRRPLPAHTEWETLSFLDDGSALVRARLHSGRAHQVRAHLSAAGFAILGDPIYSDQPTQALARVLNVTALRLHAESIRLRHPLTGASLLVVAPPPAWAAGGASSLAPSS